MNQILEYNSIFLGIAIFMFGFLKLFDPFKTWFHVQIAKSGLPPFCIPLGMAGEMSIGLSLLLAIVFRERITSLFNPVVALASAGLVVSMAVAIYVHLQPEVPADVLPLGIKPPFIPVFFMLLAGLNLFQLYRPNVALASSQCAPAEGCNTYTGHAALGYAMILPARQNFDVRRQIGIFVVQTGTPSAGCEI